MSVVVVGGSLAGGRCAESVRRLGYEARVVVVSAEPHRPYDRPPLSKKLLHRELDEEKLFLRKPDFYEKNTIELLLGRRAEKLDPSAHTVTLDGGETLEYEHVVIATGADVRKLRCAGADLDGVHYVRTLEDSHAVRDELVKGRRAVVIGAGVIGAEVAAACRKEGVEVAMLEALELPLLRAFGKEVGAIYAQVHRDEGVDLRCGVVATELRGTDGRVSEVLLDDGTSIACDFVVVGIGVTPAVGWLEGSGVAIDGAVLVDDHCRTNVPNVWAAGDVAAYFCPPLGRHVRVESVDNAQLQAMTVAKNIVGQDDTYAPVPFFWSDQYDLKLQSVGLVTEDYDRVVFRGSIDARTFIAFHLKGERVQFAVGVNRLKEINVAKRLVASGATVSAEALADENVSAKELLQMGS
jgi:3-phenylpropionate/trans-cinnamate dioxygenase ferredoxin reductase subunit